MKRILFWIIVSIFIVSCSNQSIKKENVISHDSYSSTTSASYFVELDQSTIDRIQRYNSNNAEALIEYVNRLAMVKKDYAKFVLENSSDNDLAVLTPEYLDEHLTYALKAKELPYVKSIPEQEFRHFVLPLRVSQEPFENWRKKFFDDLYPKVSQAKTINEAIMIADLYYLEGVYFKQTSGRDQGPLLCIKRGYGRCEEMMILQMCVARAIGIPCRPASASYWSFTDSNHVWTEVWTPQGWKIVPEAYPQEYRTSSWEIDRAMKAPMITSTVFGKYPSYDVIEDNEIYTEINTTENYNKTVPIKVRVMDENKLPVVDAKVYFYATTFGGLFVLYSTETDSKGQVNLKVGETSMYVTAGKDGEIASGLISTVKGLNELSLTLKKNNDFNEDMVYYFPLSSSSNRNFQLAPEDKLFREQMHDLANKRRDQRLLSQRKTIDFLNNYPLENTDEESYVSERTSYLEKTDLLAGNSENWKEVDEWINEQENKEDLRQTMVDIVNIWNIKDLIELPDVESIKNLIELYTSNRNRYKSKVSHEMFKENVISPIFGANPFPETGYQLDLYKNIVQLQEEDIDATVTNLYQWVKNNTIIDTMGTWSYFSGSLTPTQLVNKKYLSESQTIYLLTSMLQNAGIPARWQGFLEYYNGDEWKELKLDFIQDEESEEKSRSLVEFELKMLVDGEEVQPSPWSNFLLASHKGDGLVTNCWFDFYEKEGKYFVKYYQEEDQDNYFESYIRNQNGDAHVQVSKLDANSKEMTISLNTPKTSIENNIQWKRKTIHNITSFLENEKLNEGLTLLFVRNKNDNEPQERMLEQLQDKSKEFADKNVKLIVYTQERSDRDINKNNEGIKYFTGKQIITESLELEDYPLIFIFKNDVLISSANGYDMGLINYLLRTVD